MDILILSVSAGGGHSHAAEAVKQHVLLKEPDSRIEIIDTLKYINPVLDKVIIGSYLKTIKMTPALFGKLYYFSENDEALATVSKKINEMMASKLLQLIQDFNPQVIISTHPFPTEMVSILKRKYKIEIPIICILTDYSPHSFWIHPMIDAYVVSNKDMKEEMIERGVNGDQIFDLGIPTDPDFLDKFDKSATFKELNFNLDKPTFMVMGGSLGIGKISIIYKELLDIKKDIQILVITGNNKKLYSELLSIENTSNKAVKILGYTEEVNKYMQACDLLITKPGGLTISEALICRIPMAIFSPIPGQEERNADFLFRHNLAINLGNGDNCKEILDQMLEDKNSFIKMKENCKNFGKPQVGDSIYKLIESMIIKN